jgi:hypothetical protein
VKKLIQQIGSFGSLRKALVCMLPRWQKPEGAFMTPTYLIGGSDSSHTRQGGINIANMLTAMVLKLLVKINKEMNRENILPVPFLSGISIKNEKVNIFSIITVFSIPKVLSKP